MISLSRTTVFRSVLTWVFRLPNVCKTTSLPRMAHVAISETGHHRQQAIVVAVTRTRSTPQPVAGCLALHPERVASAAEKRGEALSIVRSSASWFQKPTISTSRGVGVLDDRRNRPSV